MADERRQYRVSGTNEEELAVSLGTSPESRVPVVVENLSIGGMRISVDREAQLEHALGETVYIRIESPHLESFLAVPCIVCHRGDLGSTCEYSLRFVDWLGLLSCLPPELVALFNRRGDRRYEPAADDPVPVLVHSTSQPDTVIQAFLRDLSSLGLSFRASPRAEAILSSVREVLVSFSLPGVETRFEFVASIRHRNLMGDDVCYGVLFDPQGTVQFSDSQALIEEFITERRTLVLETLVS